MKFLVDTNILSEPTKPQPNHGVEKWKGTCIHMNCQYYV